MLNALKTIFKNSHTVKIIDKPICDLPAYLKELSSRGFKHAVVRYGPKVSLRGVYADVILIDPAQRERIPADLVKYAGRDCLYVYSSDYADAGKHLPKSAAQAIDFGLNSTAAITASSVSDDSFLCSVTRTVPSVFGHEMEMQEILVKYHPNYSIEQMLLLMSGLIAMGFLF